jgi:biopolymer transport protein ExbD
MGWRRSSATLWVGVAGALAVACSRRSPPERTTTDPAVSAAASAIARAIVGPPPHASGRTPGPKYEVHVRCDAGGACVADLVDDHGLPAGKWDFSHLSGLSDALRSRGVSEIVLTADPSVPYARVIEVMDAARLGGAPDISFAAPTRGP